MKITVLDGNPLNPGDISWSPLERFGELIVYPSTTAAEIKERAKDAQIILTNKVPLGKEELPYLSQCSMVGVLATGVNVVDLKALKEAGITICNVPAYGPEDVAQHALALLMEISRAISLHSREVKEGEWSKRGWCFWEKAPLSLTGLKLGIIGFGTIGQIMGRYGQALGMEILANSRSRHASAEYPFRYADLDEIWKEADVISLHCPLTKETNKLINKNTLAKMKPGAILLNTARGDLVDENDAAHALRSGQLGALGTDVLSSEPPDASNPLLEAPNTLITPHMAWATPRARQNIINIMAANIEAFLKGDPINTV